MIRALGKGPFTCDIRGGWGISKQRRREQVISIRLDGLVIVARKTEAKAMIKFASLSKRVVWVKQPEAAIVPLTNWLAPGDTLLLKASHNVGLNRLIPLLEKQFAKSDSSQGYISS